MKHLSVVLAAVAMLLGASPGSAQVGRSTGVVNVDQATAADLAKLPHLNDALAQRIVERRPFKSMLEVHALLGLTPAQSRELYARLFLPLNLNTATRDEIMLVPGMGARIAHEFEEYRPYTTLAQFRREIGKYVDQAEVARLEQYVFVPLDLNSASDADLQTIPGLGARMLREFKEYRPYRSMEQFRREIGKYVDAKEVARLERYVTIR
jgi:DNA uptake protein ComE-like DNA-binding protein